MNGVSTTFQFACVYAALGGLFGALAIRYDAWLWMVPWLILSAAGAVLARRLLPGGLGDIEQIEFWGTTLVLVTLLLIWCAPGFVILRLWNDPGAVASSAALLAVEVTACVGVLRAR